MIIFYNHKHFEKSDLMQIKVFQNINKKYECKLKTWDGEKTNTL